MHIHGEVAQEGDSDCEVLPRYGQEKWMRNWELATHPGKGGQRQQNAKGKHWHDELAARVVARR